MQRIVYFNCAPNFQVSLKHGQWVPLHDQTILNNLNFKMKDMNIYYSTESNLNNQLQNLTQDVYYKMIKEKQQF
uniref:Uncharacterized protein n=1 Tax=Brassica campestris TaxID=3711 RepID=A0A3P5ZI17_BRACM|nr:unnamed protein product [Brassica rapa]